jgi:glycosyltransferase involved in cell wall biosynthesis
MNVAFLTMGIDIGGAKQDVLTLSQELCRKGHNIFVLSVLGVMDEELKNTGVQFIPAPFCTRNPVGLWKASRVLRNIIRENNIELVNPQGMFTAAIAWLSQWGMAPSEIVVVTTIHMISSLRLYKWAWTLNIFSKAIITESNCERNRLMSGGVISDKITVISNSVDMVKFSSENTKPILRDEYHLNADKTIFGLIARLSPEKRHIDFIEAARIVNLQYPDAHFFIVGSGPCQDEIQKLSIGTEGYLHLTGQRRDIPDILKSLTCFVLNSKVESLPLSIREAMSMALPVIVTDVGGNREAVLEGLTGWVVQPCTPQAIAERMIWIIENKEAAVELGKEGRILCQSCFEMTEWGNKTEAFFRQCLRDK